jgi:hypothetical protein
MESVRLTWRLRELAAASGLSQVTLWKAVRAGRLRARRVGRALLIEDTEARRFLGLTND